MNRRIAVVSVGRSDYGLYYPLLRAIEAEPQLDLHLIVGGAHLSGAHGNTIEEIRKDGIPISEIVHMVLASDDSAAVSISMGVGVINFTTAFRKIQPDVIV